MKRAFETKIIGKTIKVLDPQIDRKDKAHLLFALQPPLVLNQVGPPSVHVVLHKHMVVPRKNIRQ
jgi:hypothetical protein